MKKVSITSLSTSSYNINQRHFWVGLFLILLAFSALFLHSIPVIYIAAFLLLYVIVSCNLYENIFSFAVFLPNIAGYIFNPLGINHVGGIIKYIGVAMLLALILFRRANLNIKAHGLLTLLAILLLLTISVITTSGGDHAFPKLTSTFRHGLIVFFAYSFLFSNIEKYDCAKLGLLYIVIAIFLIPMSIPVNGISGPSDLFDFAFLRYQTHEEFFAIEEDAFHISYQGAGFLLLIGWGFYMIDSKKNKLWQILVILAIIIFALLYVGSRQAIVSILIMGSVWALFMNRSNNSINRSKSIYRLGIIALFFGVMYYLIGTLTSEGGLLYSVAEEGFIEGGGRGLWLQAGIDQFLSHPVFGVGYGRFMVLGQYGSYPHNLFVELLCETGLVGFSIVAVLGIAETIRNRMGLMPFLMLWLAYFLRSMVSGDFSMNIYVFAILFALSSAKTYTYRESDEGKFE